MTDALELREILTEPHFTVEDLGEPVPFVGQRSFHDRSVAAGDDEAEEFDPEACPGCGCRPGDGVSDLCEDPEGCGFFKSWERATGHRE